MNESMRLDGSTPLAAALQPAGSDAGRGEGYRSLSAGILVLGFLLAGALLLTVGGCATLRAERPAPVTVAEVVQMSKAGVPAAQIIQKMRDSGTLYRLKASQLADLRSRGVSDPVINYMQRTYLDAVRRDQAWADWNHWTLNDDGYWYAVAPFGPL
jgi:hypothetical protein